MAGSGLFSDQSPIKRHLLRGSGGLQAEVADVRKDVGEVLEPMAAVTVEEFIDPAAADTDGIMTVVQSLLTTEVTYDDTLEALAADVSPPRNVTVTTGAGGTPGHSPSEATIVGKDINGAAISEVIALSQAAGTDVGALAFAVVESVTFKNDGTGTGAALEVGFGDIIGLAKPLLARAGLAAVTREVEAGVVVTTGTFVLPASSTPNGTYLAATVPDAANDYALYYEYDPTA